jgi:hypothetical protein
LVQGPEGGEKANILSEIGQQPQVMLSKSQCPQQSEDYNPKNGQGNDEDQKARSGNTQVVNSFSVKWKRIIIVIYSDSARRFEFVVSQISLIFLKFE